MPLGRTPNALKITPIHSRNDNDRNEDDSEAATIAPPLPVQLLSRTPSPGILQSSPVRRTASPGLFIPKSTSAPAPLSAGVRRPIPSADEDGGSPPSGSRMPTIRIQDLDAVNGTPDGDSDEERDGAQLPSANDHQASSVSWAPTPVIKRAPSPALVATARNEAGPSAQPGMRTSLSAPALPIQDSPSSPSPPQASAARFSSSSSASSPQTASTPSLRATEADATDDEAWEANQSRRASIIHAVSDLRKQLGLTSSSADGLSKPPITPGRTPLVEELEDGTDPLDWNVNFKRWATFCYCVLIMSTTFGSSSYAAATPTVQAVFGVSRTVALLGTSLYVLGFALGPLLWAPTSEIVGRKPVYVGSFIALTGFGLGASFAQNIQTLIVCRFLSGVCGASALNNVAASISDMTRVRNRLRYNTAYRLVSFGGPTLGPIIGTFVLRIGWRWNLRLNPIFSFCALVLYALTVPESHRPTLLRRQQRARERAIQAQSDLGKEESAIAMKQRELLRQPRGPPLLQRYWIAATRPWKLLKEPLVIVVCVYTAILYGHLYGLLAAFPLIWQEIRGRNEEYASLVYLALLGGFAAGALFIGCWFQDRSFKRLHDMGLYTPESRIGPALWASFLVPIGLIIFGWTSPYDELVGEVDVHFVVPCLALVVFAAGMGIVFNSWLSYLSDAYSTQAASVMAAATFSRSLLGAAFPLFMREMLMGMTIQGTFTFFCVISTLLSIAGIFIVKKGEKIRERSKYATSDTR